MDPPKEKFRIRAIAEILRNDRKHLRRDCLSAMWEKIDFKIGLVFQLADTDQKDRSTSGLQHSRMQGRLNVTGK